MAFRPCTVSFVYQGQRHTAKVDAETAYEAAVLALKQFDRHRFAKGPDRRTILQVEVDAPLKLKLKVADVLEWLYEKPGQTREQQERKKRLRVLLADERR